MDIVDFLERFADVELLEWQKRYIRSLDKMRINGSLRFITGRRGQMYVYMNPKELILNGPTNDCK